MFFIIVKNMFLMFLFANWCFQHLWFQRLNMDLTYCQTMTNETFIIMVFHISKVISNDSRLQIISKVSYCTYMITTVRGVMLFEYSEGGVGKCQLKGGGTEARRGRRETPERQRGEVWKGMLQSLPSMRICGCPQKIFFESTFKLHIFMHWGVITPNPKRVTCVKRFYTKIILPFSKIFGGVEPRRPTGTSPLITIFKPCSIIWKCFA